MAIEVTAKIDIGIQTEEKTSRYPVVAYLSLSPEKEKEFEAFKDELKRETEEMEALTQKGKRLSREIIRLQEDIEEIEEDMEDPHTEDDKRADLRKKRRKIRKQLRALEDELDRHNQEHDTAYYQQMLNDMVEKIAKKSFDMNIKDDERKEALESAIKKYGIKYGIVVSEIGRLIEEAKRKKKKRS